ncbi:hypothetical protein ASPWEDRAFT_183145 [Aspergillus wentii DTO 134E9]|uniref:Caspase family p20 domain-containing protein n=1 Tax=Aspergillus wentii DTO 134E9 TaxID=1073089 RepID=A0A1L9RJK2_ASPWE|nr:uncharacterized protein ASPWEDRAFT_183145 [Aspergillus wentii DTO 134E9]OJJ35027.1 hypothetical protein ASPWEDRAFT_183145 [Aspergillus wentii DTO 134E9]
MDPSISSSPSESGASRSFSTVPTSLRPSPVCQNCLGSATFPSTIGSSHLSIHSSEVQGINRALKGGGRRGPYKAVSVLLLSWNVTNLEWDAEIRKLREILEDQFKFYIFDNYKIDLDSNAEDKLLRHVLDFKVECGGRDGLLIVYYSGHGDMDDRGDIIWTATERDTPAELNWSNIQPWLFERYRGDVLMILDCCHAGAAAKAPRTDTKEILAACRAGGTTYATGDFTFTKILIRELQQMYQIFGRSGFSIFELRCEMRKKLPIEPIHVVVMGRTPIELTALYDREHQGPEDCLGHGADSDMSLLFNHGGRALVSFLFHETLDDIQPLLLRWLKDHPFGVTDIKVEALYHASSTLVLVSMPVRLWAFLPDHPAICFIGLLESKNMASRLNAVADKEALGDMLSHTQLDPRKPAKKPVGKRAALTHGSLTPQAIPNKSLTVDSVSMAMEAKKLYPNDTIVSHERTYISASALSRFGVRFPWIMSRREQID